MSRTGPSNRAPGAGITSAGSWRSFQAGQIGRWCLRHIHIGGCLSRSGLKQAAECGQRHGHGATAMATMMAIVTGSFVLLRLRRCHLIHLLMAGRLGLRFQTGSLWHVHRTAAGQALPHGQNRDQQTQPNGNQTCHGVKNKPGVQSRVKPEC